MDLLKKIFVEKMGLEEIYFERFYALSELVTYKKKEYLIEEGKVCDFIGFVESGIVKSFMRKDGVDYNNGFYLPNHFFSAYSSFTKQRPAVSNLQAMQETTVRVIGFDQLNGLYDCCPKWYKLGKYIAEDFYYRKCDRETSLLQDSAAERLNRFLKKHPNIEQLVPQYEIASYLSIQPESLSRIKALTYIKEK